MSVASNPQPLRNAAFTSRDSARSVIAQASDGAEAIAKAFRNHLILWGYSYGLVVHGDCVYAFTAKDPAMNLNWYFEHAPESVVGVYTPRAGMEQIRADLEAQFS